MNHVILVLNCGSSSVKFQLFGSGFDLPLMAKGSVTDIGSGPVLKAWEEASGETHEEALPGGTHEKAVQRILEWIEVHKKLWKIVAVGHRVAHGGPNLLEATAVDEPVMAELEKLTPLAPLHQPHNLGAIRIIGDLRPDLVQIACFDTAFHSRHEHLFTAYALPYEFTEKGVRRYGFHGLSYEWIAQVLERKHPALAVGRVVVAHLGNGASLCAMKNGKSIDSTMGMTALDGLPMGTRSGSIDPGVIIYMIREMGIGVDDVEHILYNESGLKGLSSMSNDVAELLKSERRRARFALDFFALKTAQFAASMAVSMGGMDALVFTGGIGENAAPVREAVKKHLKFMPSFESLVIPANEERMIAKHVRGLI